VDIDWSNNGMRPPARIAHANLSQLVDRHTGLQLVQKVRPRIREADGVAGIDLENGWQGRIENSKVHRFVVRLDRMDLASVTASLTGRRIAIEESPACRSIVAALLAFFEPRSYRG